MRSTEYVIYTNISSHVNIINELVEEPVSGMVNISEKDARSIFESTISSKINVLSNYFQGSSFNIHNVANNYEYEAFRKKYHDEINFKLNLPLHFNPTILHNIVFKNNEGKYIIFILVKMSLRHYFIASNMPFNRSEDIGIASILEHKLLPAEFEALILEHRKSSNIHDEIIEIKRGESINIIKYNALFNGHIESSIEIVCPNHREIFFQVSINR